MKTEKNIYYNLWVLWEKQFKNKNHMDQKERITRRDLYMFIYNVNISKYQTQEKTDWFGSDW